MGSHDVLVKVMLEMLFKTNEEALQNELNSILIENKKHNPTSDGYWYEGQFYASVKGAKSKIPLHESLHQRKDMYLEDKKTIEEDKQLIKQYLYKITKTIQSLQDLRDSIPDCLVRLIPALNGYQRINDVGECLDKRTRDYTRYVNVVVPKIHMYSAMRLLN